MSTFKIPEFDAPVTVKKPPVKVSVSQPAQPAQKVQPKSLQSMVSAMPEGRETQPTPVLPNRSWDLHQSDPTQITASDLLAGDREIWAKGVILAMVLGKPRCKNKGWR